MIISKSELGILRYQKLLNASTSNTSDIIDWDLLMSKNRGFDKVWSGNYKEEIG